MVGRGHACIECGRVCVNDARIQTIPLICFMAVGEYRYVMSGIGTTLRSEIGPLPTGITQQRNEESVLLTASIVTAVIALKIADGFLCSYKAIIEEIVTNNYPINKLYFKDHWSYTKTVDTFKVMLDDTRADFVCGLPYQLSIQEGLLFPEDVGL